MGQYVVMLNFTDATASDFAARPRVQSARELRESIETLLADATIGGELIDMVFTLGQYDSVLFITAPSEQQVAAFSLALGRMIGARTTTLSGFDDAMMDSIIDDASRVDGG